MNRLSASCLCALAACAATAQPAAARRSSHNLAAAMMRLDPDTRYEQRCNGEAIAVLQRREKGFSPNEVVAYAFAKSEIRGGQVLAPGAAIRSRGEWYHLSYACRPTHDGLGVESFRYTLGDVVPHAEWSDHYLVP